MWIHGKGLTFIECIMATVIVVLFLVVVLPVFSSNEIDFRQDNIHTNLNRFHQQVDGYHRDYGGVAHEFSRGFSSGERFRASLTSAGNTETSGYWHGVLPRQPLVMVLPEKEIGKIP